jgi:hypothetical protein
MRSSLCSWLLLLLLFGRGACAQEVFHDDEVLSSDRPEAWAMNYMAAGTYMTAFGDGETLAPGHWSAALELGQIPRLSATQRQVGFDGFKVEDLNRSPVFGRLRLMVGLPARWVGEIGYTPPVEIDGTKAHGLFAAAIGRRMISRDRWTLSARLFGQHGSVQGDITCPADIAGSDDSVLNPYGCQAASRDRATMNYYGSDVTAGGGRGDWRWHASVGLVRTELAVHLDALTFSLRDRSRLTANSWQHYLAAGASHDLGKHWNLGAELLFVPLSVRRDPTGSADNDPMTSFRLLLRNRRG